jgi:hypothetical protein
MESFHEYIDEYRKQLGKGAIQKAYKGLMEYIMSLRTYFKNKYPDYFVSGNIYYGYMDMTYFALNPDSLKNKKLRIAIVFNYDTFRFEVWLAGINKQIQQKYWNLIKESNWNKYHLVPSIEGMDSILEHTLADNPDFSNLDALTKQIEKGTLEFIKNVEDIVSN